MQKQLVSATRTCHRLSAHGDTAITSATAHLRQECDPCVLGGLYRVVLHEMLTHVRAIDACTLYPGGAGHLFLAHPTFVGFC